MRWLLLFLLAAPVLADDVLTDEVRAWSGEIVVEARSGPDRGGHGEEVQIESARFVAVTDPRRTAGARERLRLRLRRTEGSWKLKIDLKEDRGGGELVTRGRGEGKLHLTLAGVVDASKGTIQFKTGAKPHRLVARTMLSGVDAQGLAAFRTVASRTPYLGGLDERGTLSGDGRTARGERTFEDRRGKYPRTVTVRWKLERLDPEVRGRVLDQHGKAVAGVTVLARTFLGGRMLLKSAETGADGRFAIPVPFASWGVQVLGREKDGILTSGLVEPDAAPLRFDSVPDLELRVTRYRLHALPRANLLATHFDGNVDDYLAFIAMRVPASTLARAEVKSATR